MPPNTVKVARPALWGNPFKVGKPLDRSMLPWVHNAAANIGITIGEPLTQAQAVEMFRAFMEVNDGTTFGDFLCRQLRGKNLACWCPLDKPCHADVLLEIANAKGGAA